ncbi:hypothetical protein ACJ5NV_09105 [Loktanella agnita]
MQRIMNMAMRMLMRHGLSGLMNRAAHRGRNPEDMTPEERRAARDTSQRGQRMIRVLRRFMR